MTTPLLLCARCGGPLSPTGWGLANGYILVRHSDGRPGGIYIHEREDICQRKRTVSGSTGAR